MADQATFHAAQFHLAAINLLMAILGEERPDHRQGALAKLLRLVTAQLDPKLFDEQIAEDNRIESVGCFTMKPQDYNAFIAKSPARKQWCAAVRDLIHAEHALAKANEEHKATTEALSRLGL